MNRCNCGHRKNNHTYGEGRCTAIACKCQAFDSQPDICTCGHPASEHIEGTNLCTHKSHPGHQLCQCDTFTEARTP